jgi:hypothetical protein
MFTRFFAFIFRGFHRRQAELHAGMAHLDELDRRRRA